MNKEKIIIDTDPGVDDAVALFTALASKELDILGITTVAGNVPLETAFVNARKICALAGREDVLVYKGADKPLKRDFVDSKWVHGNDGIGGVVMPESNAGHNMVYAVDFLLETLSQNDDGEIILATMGPLTNIALALKEAPNIMKKLKKIVIMGGSFDKKAEPRGNASPYAEYNIFADPHSADIVFNSGINMVVVPMETGKQALADDDFIYKLKKIEKTCAEASAEMLLNVMERMKTKKTPLYDPCITGYLLKPDLFQTIAGKITTIVDEKDEKFGLTDIIIDKNANCFVANKIDNPEFLKIILEKLALL